MHVYIFCAFIAILSFFVTFLIFKYKANKLFIILPIIMIITTIVVFFTGEIGIFGIIGVFGLVPIISRRIKRKSNR